MTPQDFKALLAELKKINENLNLLWKTIYVGQNQHEPGDSHIKVNDLAPLHKVLKTAEAGVGKAEKKLLKGVRELLTEIQNSAMKGLK